jgi:CheY-like chemotaxis protein
LRSIDREQLQLHLSNAGYEVLAAEDAIAAGRMLLWQQPDLILTDIHTIFLTCSPEAEESAGTPNRVLDKLQ